MSKIHTLKIENYRGLHHFEQCFNGQSFVVLIGRGDSGKTTVLKAISAVLSPNWRLSFTDLDFYEGNVERPIEIEATLTDVPQELLTDSKYGLYYRLLKGDEIVDDITDPKADQNNPLLTIKLRVDATLEPKWTITKGRDGIEDKEISASDRAKLNMFMISDYVDNHFTYSKGSPLYALLRQRLPDKNAISEKFVEIARKAHAAVDEVDAFHKFDESTNEVKEIAKKLGLSLDELKTLLEFKENVYTESNISLHDGKIPYRFHGKGSKRLLSFAIQKQLTEEGGIVLIDEIEQGLEPDRIVNLVRLLKEVQNGQVFVTTHSSYVLVESEYQNLFLMRKGNDTMMTFSENLQSILRSQPEAFFAKRVICCEGKTEQGALRRIDTHLREIKNTGFASLGIGVANAKGGNKFYTQTESFEEAKYDVCIFADNDVKDLEKLKEVAKERNIPIFLWDEGNCFEKQLFKDLVWESVVKLVDYAIRENPKHQIKNSLGLKSIFDLNQRTEEERKILRIKLGQKSKEQSWFKNIPGGEFLGQVWIESQPSLSDTCTLKKNFNELMKWINGGLD